MREWEDVEMREWGNVGMGKWKWGNVVMKGN